MWNKRKVITRFFSVTTTMAEQQIQHFQWDTCPFVWYVTWWCWKKVNHNSLPFQRKFNRKKALTSSLSLCLSSSSWAVSSPLEWPACLLWCKSPERLLLRLFLSLVSERSGIILSWCSLIAATDEAKWDADELLSSVAVWIVFGSRTMALFLVTSVICDRRWMASLEWQNINKSANWHFQLCLDRFHLSKCTS